MFSRCNCGFPIFLQHIDKIMSTHGKQIMQAVTLILEGEHSIEVKEQVRAVESPLIVSTKGHLQAYEICLLKTRGRVLWHPSSSSADLFPWNRKHDQSLYLSPLCHMPCVLFLSYTNSLMLDLMLFPRLTGDKPSLSLQPELQTQIPPTPVR